MRQGLLARTRKEGSLKNASVCVALCYLLQGVAAQQPSIPPDFFIVDIGPNAPPPPPPPPPPPGSVSLGFDGQPATPPPAATSTSSAAPPNASSTASTANAAPQSVATGSSSGLSGGAIAGIVIGAIVGVALLGLLALFVMRRRRRGAGFAIGPRKMESGLGDGPAHKPDDLHNNLAPLHPNSGHGLSWKEGDEVFSGHKGGLHPSLSEEAGVPRPGVALQQKTSTDKDSSSSSFMQVMADKTAVIVQRGPGGSVKIAKAPTSQSTVSHLSAGTELSQPASIPSQTSGETSASLGLPSLPWSDWEIRADDIHLTEDEDGPVKLGSGAYGTVYKATIDGVSEVAVKIFHDVHNQLQQADILREVAILKSCRDQNIVQFLGACIMDERIMLVTELMEAGDLWHAMVQYHDTKTLTWYKRGKRIAIEVARGLHFLHRHKIIHFDLKSPNVLLTRDGTAKISDVGFANILSNTHLSNNAAGFTFAWAAPEVLIGSACTDKVDIFSYGVLLWEIVTGEQPKRGQLRESRVPEECPAEVEALIQRCLSFDPEQRPTCKQIVEILSKAADDLGPAQRSG